MTTSPRSTEYEWRAPSGVRVVSVTPYDPAWDRGVARTALGAWVYASTKYLKKSRIRVYISSRLR